DKPWSGYDYDTFADDLKSVLDHLDLENVTLVGFSMGGGEVVRYFSRHGGKRVSKVVLLASIAPFTLKTSDNPDGVPKEVFDNIINALENDRGDFLAGLLKVFYGVDENNQPVSQSLLDWNLALGMQALPKATIDCVHAFGETDFRAEMSAINVPALVIHGDADNIVPIKPTGEQASKLIPDSTYKVYNGAPHGLLVTERDKFNKDLVDFIKS
ncbi:MAG TPA: alpha/beta hydrolase, partial [Sphingobacteriaceae bacterium]